MSPPPTLAQWFTAFAQVCEDENTAMADRLTKPSSETRNAHRAAVKRKAELKRRLERIVRDVDERLDHCSRTHIEVVDCGVFAIDLRAAVPELPGVQGGTHAIPLREAGRV